MGYRIGVDIGGSFTDFAILDEDTFTIKTLKVFSRPDEPGAEVIKGLSEAQQRYGIDPKDVTYFTHGTTVGINTVIQRKGLTLALITTRHFGDVLELARLRGTNMYDLLAKRPVPLIARHRVFEVDERLRADGSIELPLDEETAIEALKAARASGAEGIVVSFLHSYRNDVHEARFKQLARKHTPEMHVFSSAEIWPIIREYERTITATIGAYVQPRVAHYLTKLQDALKDIGVPAEPRLTKSNGGVMTAERGKEECVQMILSGTASGVIGAAFVAAQCGVRECMSLDIGGTSADVALILDGEPQHGSGELIGDFRIHIPTVSVSSIGEGGGSIASVDSFGVLHVGPESAGSNPGPVCYGRGGSRPTITDAFAVCGMIGQAPIGYSAVNVDVAAARNAIAQIAEKLGNTVEDTAEAIIRIAISGMYGDIGGVMSRHGVDPRAMSVLAFGGAGPMLGVLLAREIDAAEVIVPVAPGVLSAMGGLIADLKNDFIKTLYIDLAQDATNAIREGFAAMRKDALEWLHGEQNYKGTPRFVYSADIRYRGQSFELETVLDELNASSGNVNAIAQAFHETHKRIYGHSDSGGELQLIALRLVVTGATPRPNAPKLEKATASAAAYAMAPIYLDGAMHDAPFYARSDLLAGHEFTGPCVVVQDDCTTCVPPNYTVKVDDFGNLRITKGSR